MKTFVLAACLALCAAPALAQGAAAPKVHVLRDEPVSGVPAKHAVTATVDWPAGAETGRHTHPGDEYAFVEEGTIEIDVDGKAPATYRAGQSYHNAEGVVHNSRNVGGGPAKTVAVFIVDKGKPVTQPVK